MIKTLLLEKNWWNTLRIKNGNTTLLLRFDTRVSDPGILVGSGS